MAEQVRHIRGVNQGSIYYWERGIEQWVSDKANATYYTSPDALHEDIRKLNIADSRLDPCDRLEPQVILGDNQ